MPMIVFGFVLPVIFLILAIGATVLWKRTKRMAVLVQLIASGFILAVLVVENVATYLMMKVAKPALFNAINSSPALEIGQIAFLICLVAFPVGYLWDVLGQKRL